MGSLLQRRENGVFASLFFDIEHYFLVRFRSTAGNRVATCLISIGSNLGNRQSLVDFAIGELTTNPAINSLQASSYHTSQPIGGPAGQGEFVNAAAVIETALAPIELLDLLQSIEDRAGRKRDLRWGERSLDLDLILYDDVILNDARLILPHPRMAFRRFVLAPASEIAAAMVHPRLKRSVTQLLRHLNEAPAYFAITGIPGAGKRRLAQAVGARAGGTTILEERPTDLSATGSASPTLRAELEFLNERFELLRDVVPPVSGPFSISNFWLGQSLAFATQLSPIDRETLTAHLNKYQQQVVSPKLIVVIEVNFDESQRNENADQLAALQQRILEQMLKPGQPPTLRLSAAHPSWNEEEVAAAIHAM